MKKNLTFLSLVIYISCFGQQPELVIPIGHTWYINQVAISPDGQYVLTGGQDGAAILWEAQTGRKIYSFTESAREVHAVAFSPDGKLIVTGNEKGEVTVWDAQSGRKITVLSGHNRAVKAIVFSPDMRILATGGVDSKINIWKISNWEITHTFQDHSKSVNALAFSPKGKYLLSGSSDQTAIIRELKNQEAIRLRGHSGAINSVAFSPNGKWVLTGSSDRTASVWRSSSGEQVHTLIGHKKAVNAVDFSPDGKLILSGGADHSIRLWESSTGTLTKSWGGYKNIIRSAAFAPDGASILLGGGAAFGQSDAMLWEIESEQLATRFAGDYSMVNEVNFSVDGRQILTRSTLQGTDIQYTWDALSTRNYGYLKEEPAIARIHYSPDSNYVLQSETLYSRQEFEDDLKDGRSIDRKFNFKGQNIPGKVNLVAMSGKHTDRVHTLNDHHVLYGNGDQVILRKTPKLDSAYSLSGHTQMVLSVAFSPGGKQVLSGAWDDQAILWDLETKDTILSLRGHGDGVAAVSFSPDGQFLLTGSYDNTVKLWSRQNGSLVATLVALDSLNWIVTTPSGLFDASPAAMDLMHYVVNYQGDWEVIELNQLKARYYEPGLLPKILGFTEEYLRPVEAFEDIALYPKTEIKPIKNNELDIQLIERNGGIGKISIFINGKEVTEEANPLPRRENAKRPSQVTFNLRPFQNYLFRHQDSTNIITVRAYNEEGWLKSPAVKLEYHLPAAQARGTGDGTAGWVGQYDPKLYVVSVGTANYSGTKLDLLYADQDATMMAKAMEAVGTALFTNGDSLEVYCLSTATADSTGLEGSAIRWQFATKENIESVFKEIKQQAKAEDLVMVYLSGHGVTYGNADQAQFHYLTQGIASEDLSDNGVRRAYTISSDELTRWINNIPALKQVLIIDACNSGQIVENLTSGTKALNSSQIRALDRMKDRTGMYVLSGSASDKVSYEAGEYGQGLLTYALLEGMRGLATRKDASGQELVDVMQLFQYARDRVPQLASSINGVQTPMLGFPQRGASIDIGILDESARAGIPIGNKKPVVIRPDFMNQATFQDDLDLEFLLEIALRKESEEGSKADLIYVDVNDYPNAYSLSGLYETTGEDIKITVKLFKDRKDPLVLELRPTDDPEQLVRYIVREVKKILAQDQHE